MPKKELVSRIYVDTSVIGGYYNTSVKKESRRLIAAIRQGFFSMLLSDLVLAELAEAPQIVQEVLTTIPLQHIEYIPLTAEILNLRDAYIIAGVVNEKSINDAGHVAAATIARASAIVSWNFKHIVRLGKIRGYNQVNLANGYGILTIISPQGVRHNEEN
ncbi:MAG: type II toxin-antitoxin system VapC family toxin [Coleofasciculaceae cyanobacterium SM2_1_6]|nr:type II toxin-antitoxin system VapC family toxin [Coleofasciculaceae cyanobacterium SM2_1_6]